MDPRSTQLEIINSDGSVNYYKSYSHFVRHNSTGPAIVRLDGTKEYWYNGQYLNISTDQELKLLIKTGFTLL